jgi:hypothetical protein
MIFARFLALVLCLCVASSLQALSVVPPSFEELVGRSEQVLRTEVLETRCVVKGEGETRRIVTLVKVRVEKAIVGEAPAELELELLGGRVGDEAMEVSGMTQFQKGDRDILFVARNGKAFCPLVAVNHGRYLLVPTESGAGEVVARADASPLRSVAEIRNSLGEPASVPAGAAGASGSSLVGSLTNEATTRPTATVTLSSPGTPSVPATVAAATASLAGALARDDFEARIAETAAALRAAK